MENGIGNVCMCVRRFLEEVSWENWRRIIFEEMVGWEDFRINELYEFWDVGIIFRLG